MKRLPYRLCDTFNGRVLSQHRSAFAAGKAAAAVDRAMSGGSHLPMALLRLGPKSRRGIEPAYSAVPGDGTDLDDDEFMRGRNDES